MSVEREKGETESGSENGSTARMAGSRFSEEPRRNMAEDKGLSRGMAGDSNARRRSSPKG